MWQGIYHIREDSRQTYQGKILLLYRAHTESTRRGQERGSQEVREKDNQGSPEAGKSIIMVIRLMREQTKLSTEKQERGSIQYDVSLRDCGVTGTRFNRCGQS